MPLCLTTKPIPNGPWLVLHPTLGAKRAKVYSFLLVKATLRSALVTVSEVIIDGLTASILIKMITLAPIPKVLRSFLVRFSQLNHKRRALTQARQLGS